MVQTISPVIVFYLIFNHRLIVYHPSNCAWGSKVAIDVYSPVLVTAVPYLAAFKKFLVECLGGVVVVIGWSV